MKPTLLITGGAGYIGSHTALLMAHKGYNVVILDTLVHKQSFNYPWATLIKSDFAHKKTLGEIFKTYKVDAVMHFAASIDIGESVRNPKAFYANNVTKTLQLIDTMRAHDVKKFIFSSSCAVYGQPEQLPLTEDHPKRPINPYGSTKLITELALQDYALAYDFSYVALRYFNAAGALPEHNLGERHEPETHLIPLLLRAAKTNTPFKIFGSDYPTPDGTCIRDFLHVWDIARAHAQALEHLNKNLPSDVFNIGTGSGVSVKQMIETVERICDVSIKIELCKNRPGDPPHLVASADKAHTILQWEARHSLLENIIKSAYIFEYGLPMPMSLGIPIISI